MRSLSIIVLTVFFALPPSDVGSAARDFSLVDLSIEASIPSNQSPSSDGRYNVILTIRNGDAGLRPAPPAIALRAVYWAEDGDDSDVWKGPLSGIDAENDDGTIDFISASGIAHTAATIPKTTRSFERGLLLVDEELQVTRPTKVTRAVTRELVVRYVIIPRTATDGLYVPIERPGEFRTVFGPMTENAWDQRRGQGGMGLIHGPKEGEPNSLEIMEDRVDVRLIFSSGPTDANNE